MAITSIAVLVISVLVGLRPCRAAETWALCRGREGCQTRNNLTLNCSSVDPRVSVMIAVRDNTERGTLAIHRQWIVPPWMNRSHLDSVGDLSRRLSRIGSEVRVKTGAHCTPTAPSQSPLIPELQRLDFLTPLCSSQSRRGAIRCRRPRHCERWEPCAVPEDPFTSPLCDIEDTKCERCCPGKTCESVQCLGGGNVPFSDTKKVFAAARKNCKERWPGCGRINHRAVETRANSERPPLYTTYDTTYVPRGTYVDSITAEHEVAHTIRYVCNGSKQQYRVDAATYDYLRAHSCKRKSNEGFSFNEGWAFFWSKDCFENNGFSEDIAGDVAHSLRSLQNRCRTSDANMVQVLCGNPGKIYSFRQFKERHQKMYNCP